MPKTTRNFFGMFSMNTYSSGKQRGNPIGDGSAIMPLKTSVNGVYHLNFHYSLNNRDALGEKVAGHVVMLGATGVGKTILQTALLAFASRFNIKIFALDREGSMRGLIEALGGTYFTLESGVPTGLNPFQLPITADNREFLYDLVGSCSRSKDKEFTAEDKKDIKEAVDGVLKLDLEERRFSVLMQSMPDRGTDCLKRRLAEWCYGFEGESDGRYAYALDNPENTFNPEDFNRVGFDVKDFLVAGHAVTEPLLSYLLHLKKLMQKGDDIMATVVEEFWLPISYPTTADQIKDILKTGRRRNEFVLLVSQSPKDVIRSPLLSDILEQVPTKIYLANPDAVYHDEVTGEGYENLGLTVKEFEKLPKDKFARKFLIKQGSQSSIARLDLEGMGDDMAILAMADEDFKYLDRAKNAVGDNPDEWIPVYTRLRNEGRAMAATNKPSKGVDN
jgi:type IV secretion system protein VirB4